MTRAKQFTLNGLTITTTIILLMTFIETFSPLNLMLLKKEGAWEYPITSLLIAMISLLVCTVILGSNCFSNQGAKAE